MTGQLLSWNAMINSNYYGTLSKSLPKFIAVVDEYEYNYDTVLQIIDNSGSSLLQGILVLNHTASSSASLSSYASPAPVSPRGEDTAEAQLTPDAEYAWNTNGDGLMLLDMHGIPTGYVDDDSIAEYILTVADQQAADFLSVLSNENANVFDEDIKKFPPIMGEFEMYMGPENMNSTTCLSWVDTDGQWRPKCLPLGGTSVWGLAGSPYERGSGSANDGDDGNADEKQPIVMVATNLDATSMFHDLSRGANTAASNILTVLMAAKLFGESVTDSVLDGLQNKIMFAFFQGENYGYMGSRSFLRDVAYPGFQCDENGTVAAIAKNKDEENPKMACLNPLRHDLAFMDIGSIKSMIAVDQVGILSDNNTFYVHNSGNTYYSDIMTGVSPDDWAVAEASAGSLPPSPLSSLVSLSGGSVGGIILTGYDAAYAEDSFYMSHMDSTERVSIDLEAIAKAATIVARTALAAAYGDAYDDDTVIVDTIAELDADDDTLNSLANCLLENGNCNFLSNYAKMERANSRSEYDTDLGIGAALGKPPSYYPSVFDSRNGQPFVQVNGKSYGAYTADADEAYGDNSDDKFLIRPGMLAMSLHGLLDDYLGRGGSDGTNDSSELKTCSSTSDCSNVAYCPNNGDKSVCTASKVCVCSRAQYHIALDEAIIPSPNNATGVFVISDDDEGVSPMYTEPYWGNDIGVHVFRSSSGAANWTLGVGIVASVGCIAATMYLNRRLRKEKLY